MNIQNLSEATIIVAGNWALGSEIITTFSWKCDEILVGNRRWTHQGHRSYQIGKLSNIKDISDNSVWIISCVWDWIQKALNDFSQKSIPTVLLSTAYRESLLERYISEIPILQVPSLALPIVELIHIFEKFPDFTGIRMEIHESHQSWKQDTSGTARKIIQIFKEKRWDFDFQWCNSYNPNEGISNFWDLFSYRWQASKKLWVSQERIESWHGYHTYDRIYGDGPNYQDFRNKIYFWSKKYQNENIRLSWCTVWFHQKKNSFRFSHNIDGRDIYADGLKQILPWFMYKQNGVHSVTDYLQQS